jgi:sugar diacid utilization regulator
MPPAQLPPDDVLRAVAGGGAADAGGLDPQLLGDFLPALAAAVAEGRLLERGMWRRCRAKGQEAARRGVALRALLDLYLSASWRLWRELPVVAAATDAPAIATAGESMLHAVDDAVAALTEGYQLARRTLVREQESARREFVDDLLSGGADVAGLTARAAGFGLHLAGPHAVAVVRAERAFTDSSPVVPVVERAVLGAKRVSADAVVLVATKVGRLVIVFAAPDDDASAQVAERIAAVLRPARGEDGEPVRLHRRADVGDWQLAVGRAQPGPAGVLSSYQDARAALRLAEQVHLQRPVVHATDLLIYQVLLRDRAAITDRVSSTLEPLRAARGGAEPLLATLAAYFDAGGNTSEAARRLHLSVRAVSYRLDRVRALTGLNPAAAGDGYTLQTATIAARLLGWPDSGTLPNPRN